MYVHVHNIHSLVAVHDVGFSGLTMSGEDRHQLGAHQLLQEGVCQRKPGLNTGKLG